MGAPSRFWLHRNKSGIDKKKSDWSSSCFSLNRHLRDPSHRRQINQKQEITITWNARDEYSCILFTVHPGEGLCRRSSPRVFQSRRKDFFFFYIRTWTHTQSVTNSSVLRQPSSWCRSTLASERNEVFYPKTRHIHTKQGRVKPSAAFLWSEKLLKSLNVSFLFLAVSGVQSVSLHSLHSVCCRCYDTLLFWYWT